nr:PREDICTED: uncharacterized protein LOC108216825 [Daucus carota subsp. sativus]
MVNWIQMKPREMSFDNESRRDQCEPGLADADRVKKSRSSVLYQRKGRSLCVCKQHYIYIYYCVFKLYKVLVIFCFKAHYVSNNRCKNISVPRIDIKYVWSILVGFGFNFVVNDYKIVCIYELGLELQNPSYRFRLYSCKDNSWKELKPNFPLQLIFVECVVVKANPYWMCLCNQRRNEFWVKVDVKTEEIQMFKGPEYVKKDTTSSSNMALGDFVAQAVCSPGAQANDMIHIYTLEENAGVWMRMYSFGLPGVQRPVRLKCFKNGKIVFTNGNQNKLYMYDLTSGKVKTLMVAQGRDMIHMPMNYTESLVSIEGMVSVGEGAVKEERQEAAPLAATNRNASNAMMSDNMD